MLPANAENFLGPVQMQPADEQQAAAWHEPATLILDQRGTIHDCSKSGELLFGYRRSDLILRHVSSLIPQLAEIVLVENRKINSRLSFLCHCGHHFTAQDREGNAFPSKLSFILLDTAGKEVLRMIVWPAGNAESP